MEIKNADRNPQALMLHNVMVVQSRKGWTMKDVEKAIQDAQKGIKY